MCYKYRIKSTESSSSKYGPCEVCGKYAAEVFNQVKLKEYRPGRFSHRGNLFGHKACLLSSRKSNKIRVAAEAKICHAQVGYHRIMKAHYDQYTDFHQATDDILNAARLAAILDTQEDCLVEIEDRDEYTVFFNILARDAGRNPHKIGDGMIYKEI